MSKFFKSMLLITIVVMLISACQPAPTAAPAAAEPAAAAPAAAFQ